MRPDSTYYAIRRTGTDFFLPWPKNGYRASWVEFSDRAPPRLFEQKRNAQYALTVWCRGRIQGAQHLGYRSVRDPSRDKAHYEVIRVELTVLPLLSVEQKPSTGLSPHSKIECVTITGLS